MRSTNHLTGAHGTSHVAGARRDDDLGRAHLLAHQRLLHLGAGTDVLHLQPVIGSETSTGVGVTDESEPVAPGGWDPRTPAASSSASITVISRVPGYSVRSMAARGLPIIGDPGRTRRCATLSREYCRTRMLACPLRSGGSSSLTRSGSSRWPNAQTMSKRPEHHRDADHCELGEAEAAHPGGLRGLGDDHVDRAAGEQQQSPCAAGERQRHEQPGRRERPTHRDHDGHRQQRRDGAVEADEGGQPRAEQHGEQQQTAHAVPRLGHQRLPHPGGHPGGIETLADHEQRRDQDDGGVAEPCERVPKVEDAGEVQRQRRADRDELHRQPVPHEGHDHGGQDEQADRGVAHQRALIPATPRRRPRPLR